MKKILYAISFATLYAIGTNALAPKGKSTHKSFEQLLQKRDANQEKIETLFLKMIENISLSDKNERDHSSEIHQLKRILESRKENQGQFEQLLIKIMSYTKQTDNVKKLQKLLQNRKNAQENIEASLLHILEQIIQQK